jgi:hypothetical protein
VPDARHVHAQRDLGAGRQARPDRPCVGHHQRRRRRSRVAGSGLCDRLGGRFTSGIRRSLGVLRRRVADASLRRRLALRLLARGRLLRRLGHGDRLRNRSGRHLLGHAELDIDRNLKLDLELRQREGASDDDSEREVPGQR